MRGSLTLIASLSAALGVSGPALAQMEITEWMYSGTGGEFIEFTNTSTSAIDLSGWSYDDDSQAPLSFDLSGFGTVAAGESVVITEDDAAQFRIHWALADSVKVLGGYTNNIGRADQINLYNAALAAVDTFSYGDAVYLGTVRTQGASGTPTSLAALASPVVTTDWVLAAVGDAYGSFVSTNGDIGNPGRLVTVVPEPGTWALLLAGLGVVTAVARRRA